MNIQIKEIKSEEVEEFANKEWGIVNKRHNFLPPKKTFYFGVF